MPDPNWKDLPAELLLRVATSCGGVQNKMRGVCKDWKFGLEGAASQLRILSSGLPPDLGLRFTALSKLDLQARLLFLPSLLAAFSWALFS